MKLVVVVLVLATWTLAPGRAWSVTFTSPFVATTSASYAQCNVTNAGTLPVSLVVDLRDYFGSPVPPSFDDCSPGPLPPRATCSVTAPWDADVHCSVTSSNSRIRSVLAVYDGATNEIQAMIAATK